MDKYKHIKETLIGAVMGQVGDIAHADAKELGEVVDMIKDMEEAMYYCTITKAMEEKEKEPKIERHYYTAPPGYYDAGMDHDFEGGRMYYPRQRDSKGRYMYGGDRMYNDGMSYYGGDSYAMNGNGSSTSNGNGASRPYTETMFPTEWRDHREGRSGISRKAYMESKEMHKDKASKVKDLEHYMHELSEDVVDMIKDASPEEKQLLEKKISALASKVAQLPA